MFCEKIAVFKTCIYHYEFNPNGRYENKNQEILNQNYQDKKKSNEIIKNYQKSFYMMNFIRNYLKFWREKRKELLKDLQFKKLKIYFYCLKFFSVSLIKVELVPLV